MIAKLGQFKGLGPRFPIKTLRNIQALTEYLEDATHPNHLAVTLGTPQFRRCTRETFLPCLQAGIDAHKARPRGRGRPSNGEVAEHVIFAPPPGVRLTDDERTRIGDNAVARIAPISPAYYIWHQGWDGRDELHVVVGNFTEEGSLRISALRRSHFAKGYLAVLQHESKAIVATINKERTTAGVPLIPTISEIRAEKRKTAGHQSLPELLFAGLGATDCLDRQLIVSLLESMGWKHRATKTFLSVTPPEKKKSYRWAWSTLLHLLSLLRHAWLQKNLEYRKELSVDIGRQPERL